MATTPDIFKVSNKSDTCTKGIEISTSTPDWSDFSKQEWKQTSPAPKILFVDSEGGGCKGETYDLQIATPTAILSDCVLFNIKGIPQPSTVAVKLGTFAMAAARMTADLAGEDAGDEPALGHLHIVFRDFELEVDDLSKPEGPAAIVDWKAEPEKAGEVIRDWYLGLGEPTTKVVKNTWKKNRPDAHNFNVTQKQLDQLKIVRSKIRDNFKSVHVWLLPHAKEKTEDFTAILNVMRNVLAEQTAEERCFAGQPGGRLTGHKMAALLHVIATTVNSGVEELPLDSMFEAALKAEAKRVVAEIGEAFKAAILESKALEHALPSAIIASMNGLAVDADASLSIALDKLGVTDAVKSGAQADLRSIVLAVGSEALRERTAEVAQMAAGFTARIAAETTPLASSLLHEFEKAIRVSNDLTVSIALEAGVALAEHAAVAVLRRRFEEAFKSAKELVIKENPAYQVFSGTEATATSSSAPMTPPKSMAAVALTPGARMDEDTDTSVFDISHVGPLIAECTRVSEAARRQYEDRVHEAVLAFSKAVTTRKDERARARAMELEAASRKAEEQRLEAEKAAKKRAEELEAAAKKAEEERVAAEKAAKQRVEELEAAAKKAEEEAALERRKAERARREALEEKRAAEERAAASHFSASDYANLVSIARMERMLASDSDEEEEGGWATHVLAQAASKPSSYRTTERAPVYEERHVERESRSEPMVDKFYKGGQIMYGGDRAPAGGMTIAVPESYVSGRGSSSSYSSGSVSSYGGSSSSSYGGGSSSGGGGTFYKGGQFLPGGGRAPAGGCYR